MEPALSLLDARVLACLVEKSITTPEYYPLTLAALTAACNQKSNRDPVMQVSEADVVRSLDGLRDRKLAWSVALAGSRVPKYRHSLTDVIPLSPPQVAVLCELMLRGPQTAAELRLRAGRMTPFADVAAVQAALQELAAREGGALAVRMPRQPGQREERYTHLLCGGAPADPAAAAAPPPEPARAAVMAENERVAALESRVAAMQDELDQLKARFSDFVKQFQ